MGTLISNRSFDATSDELLSRLIKLYTALQPNKTVLDFQEEILEPLRVSSHDEPAKIAITVPSDAPTYSMQTYSIYMDKLLQSCAYTVEALKSEENGDLEKAWAHIATAQYLLGFIEAYLILEPSISHIITARGASGASKRDAKFEPLRQLARELATKKKYTSKRNAVLSIKEEVLAAAKKQETYMSPDQAERTITKWLEGMTFIGKR